MPGMLFALKARGCVLPSFYSQYLAHPGPIIATLDTVSELGTVEGWAMYRDSLDVCHIQFRLAGTLLGEDMADKFRLDLLRAGLRYGHCAFHAAVPGIEPGEHVIELVDGRTGAVIDRSGSKASVVPVFEQRPPPRPRDVRWTDEQVLAHLQCFQLDWNYQSLGAERFLDAVFRFILGRWADQAAIDGYGDALLSARQTPAEVFCSVMHSIERKQQHRSLPTPFDAEFLFLYELVWEAIEP